MRLATTARFLLLSVMMGPIINARQSSTASEPRIETVSLCELTKNWKKYDHKIVRIEAIYATGAESSQDYDIGCLMVIRTDGTFSLCSRRSGLSKLFQLAISGRMGLMERTNGSRSGVLIVSSSFTLAI